MKDTHARSLIKGISWRATGTLDTIVVAYFVTGHLANAIKIGAIEVVAKIFLYYFHERIWNSVKWGRESGGPTHARSLVKGITWRATGTMDTIILSFFVTGHIADAFTIGGTELVTKIILYYLHERIWALFKWGRIYEGVDVDKAKQTPISITKEEIIK